MTTWVIAASIAAALLAAALGIVLVRMLSGRQPTPTEDSPPEFSLSRYQPMAQLLSGDDLEFLRGQPGVTRAEEQRFKRSRRQAFRLYLRELTADFQILHRQAREIVADSPQGSGALVGSVLRLQVDFWRFLAVVEMQLVLSQIGLGSVDSRRLIETIHSLHASVAGAASSPGPVMV